MKCDIYFFNILLLKIKVIINDQESIFTYSNSDFFHNLSSKSNIRDKIVNILLNYLLISSFIYEHSN